MRATFYNKSFQDLEHEHTIVGKKVNYSETLAQVQYVMH